MARGWFLSALACAVIAGAAEPAAAASCGLDKLAELPVTMVGRDAVVTARINGEFARLAVDTGSFFSMLTPAAAARLHMTPGPLPYGLTVRGVTGAAQVKMATAKDFMVMGVPLHGVDFLVGEHELGPVDGLLGQNLLAVADVEFDLGHGVIRLMKPHDCGDQPLAYWANGQTGLGVMSIDPILPPQNRIRGSATLNGTHIHVTFDTGDSYSVLTVRAAREAGVKTTDPCVISAGVSSGIGRKLAPSWIAPFDSFEIGGETVKNTRLRVGDLELDDSDMLIGADFFLSHRIYVSKSQRKIYFTYNGGPVFNLEVTPPPTPEGTVAAVTPPAAGQQAPAADDPVDESGFSRRAGAFVARHEYDQAIADFTRAAQLAPNDPKPLYDRGVTHALNRQPILAMDDLDQALKLKPNSAPALLMRGQLRLAEHDDAGGKADFEAALKIAPTARLRVADDLARAGLFDDALGEYDQWIAGQPHNEDLAPALAGRCRARALANRDLDKAEADCNDALSLRPGAPQSLDSRGLVRLRQGKLDQAIADYDAALKLEPDTAWSLYGRGVAELKKGQTEPGNADIAAATALMPGLPARAKAWGIGP